MTSATNPLPKLHVETKKTAEVIHIDQIMSTEKATEGHPV
jgi:hypothetical protein